MGPYGSQLRSALDRLYLAFESARFSSPVRPCPHCFTASDVVYLTDSPLRSLTHGDLAVVFTKLISTLGTPDDVAYFVPRIMEALAEGAFIEVEPFADRLAQMPEPLWTSARVNALTETFALLLAATEGTWDELGREATREHLRRVSPKVTGG